MTTGTTTKGVAMKSTTVHLPPPAGTHATCAWCRRHFQTITQLIDHVCGNHVDTHNTEGN